MTENTKIENTTNINSEETNTTMEETSNTSPEVHHTREQNRRQDRMVKRVSAMSYTSSISDQQFRALATRALKKEIGKDEWSRMSPALKKKLERFGKKVLKTIKNNPDILSEIPSDAIIKDINLNNDIATDNIDENK